MNQLVADKTEVVQQAGWYNQVVEFLNAEADMLDHKEYQHWLALWSPTGRYIVPVDPNAEDYLNTLNVAYDDEHMRRMRVERLEGGEAVSTHMALPTVRTVSRIRILATEDNRVHVRCAYCLYENKGGDLRPYPADVEFILEKTRDGFLIEQKLVRLLRSGQYLATISYLF